MGERHSEYDRQPFDNYSTPPWCIDRLLAVEEFPKNIVEPAPGQGLMVDALRAHGFSVTPLDGDFLATSILCQAVITNPPFKLADQFVRHALILTAAALGGKVAMLLPNEWDTAKGRRDVFADHSAFARKIILTERVRWANLPQTSNPSKNHSWYVWDWRHTGPPTMVWP